MTKQSTSEAVLTVVLGTVIVITVILAVAAFAALLTMLAWNLGVAALVAAAGGHVGHIGIVTAFFANVALGIVSRMLHRSPAATTK